MKMKSLKLSTIRSKYPLSRRYRRNPDRCLGCKLFIKKGELFCNWHCFASYQTKKIELEIEE